MVTIHPRSDWGARAPTSRRKVTNLTNGWFWHWLGVGFPKSSSDEQILQSIQRYHMDTKGWTDVAYSFAVGRDAEAYELRGWDISGGHTRGYNSTSMAICFLIGEGESPTPEMFRTAWAIMAERPEVTRLRAHRDVGTTSCPGDEIAAEIINQTYKEDEDMAKSYTQAEAEGIVKRAYQGILGRVADAPGLKYWSELIVAGTDVNEVKWEFFVVRAAADNARIEALAKRIDANSGVDSSVVAEQAYRMFLNNLVALNS